MKYCVHCGTALEDDIALCPNCGKAVDNASVAGGSAGDSMYCTKCGAAVHVDAVACPKCGCAIAKEEHMWGVLSLIGAIFGLIGLIFGIIGLSRCKRKKERKMCIEGIILSLAATLVAIIVIVGGILMSIYA